MPNIPAQDEVLGYFETLSNWGRWGPDDELGTLNFITPAKRLEAIGLVRDGVSVGCARPIVVEPHVPDVLTPPMHLMMATGEGAEAQEGAYHSADFLGISPHGQTISHVDALSHYFWNGTMYNGRPASVVTASRGATYGSVEVMKDGVVTRGVLLDFARLRGKPYLDAGEGIFPEDLEEAERALGVRVTEGDALLLRTGWYKRRVELGPYPVRQRPGLHAATLPWLHERDVALVAADASEDVIPSGYDLFDIPVHAVGIVAMGLCLLDACQFEELADECERRGRWDFLYMMAPLRFRNATGSPVTPLAVL
jgi:kynurenine formamidase